MKVVRQNLFLSKLGVLGKTLDKLAAITILRTRLKPKRITAPEIESTSLVPRKAAEFAILITFALND